MPKNAEPYSNQEAKIRETQNERQSPKYQVNNLQKHQHHEKHRKTEEMLWIRGD